jgi:hypothetical protein
MADDPPISPFERENHVDFATLKSSARLSALRYFALAVQDLMNSQNSFSVEIALACKELTTTPIRNPSDMDAALLAFSDRISKAIDACTGKSNASIKAFMAALGDCGLKVSNKVLRQ